MNLGFHSRSRKARKANALIEFAVIALLLYLFLAGTLTLGRMFLCAQVIGQAADTAARELARTPLPATMTFEEARDNTAPGTEFRDRIYSEGYLVIDLSAWGAGQTLSEYLDTLSPPIPLVNRMLVPVMTVERIGGNPYLRYPGALIDRGGPSVDFPSGYSVEIPTYVTHANDGTGVIRWVKVLEEIDTEDEANLGLPGDDAGADPDPFQVTSLQRGVAAVRINFPYHAIGLTERLGDKFVVADDSAIAQVNSPSGPVVSLAGAGMFNGDLGLGSQYAFGGEFRPFRRVLTEQAIARREVFE